MYKRIISRKKKKMRERRKGAMDEKDLHKIKISKQKGYKRVRRLKK